MNIYDKIVCYNKRVADNKGDKTMTKMTEEEKVNLKNYINLNKSYKDSIDVVMDLEG